MAHQSGIAISQQLSTKFIDALNPDSTIRAIKVSIVNESLDPTTTLDMEKSLLEDFGQIPSLLNDREPCYLLVRVDQSSRWLLGTFVPDDANVRDKMLYASTKATLTKSLGESYFVDSMFGTQLAEFSSKGYQRHRVHVESAAPLTEREEEIKRVKEMEQKAEDRPTMDSRRQHVSTVASNVSIDQELESALEEYSRGIINLVVVAWDAANEKFLLDRKDTLQGHDDLMGCVSKEEPRYVLYWFDSSTSMFIYSCPTASNVRLRMVYSSFKLAFMTVAKEQKDVNVGVKMEVDSLDELSGSALKAEVDVVSNAGNTGRLPSTQARFKRPAPPGRPKRR